MSHNDLHINKEKCKTTTGQKVNNVIDGLPNDVSHLSLKSEGNEDSKTMPLNSNIQEYSERNETGIEKIHLPDHNLPSQSDFPDKDDKNEQLTLLNKSTSSLPSIPLKAVPALGAIPKILQNLPSTSKSSPKKLNNESFSLSSSYSYLYYEPNQKTKLKSSSQDSSFKSIPVHNSSSSSIDSISVLPKTPEPFLIPSEVTKDTKNSLVQLNHFLSQLKGERDYSIPEINTHIEIAAIDENVKLNQLSSRKFFSLNPKNVSIKDESPCKNMSQESLIAFYDLDTIDSDEDEDNN